MAAGDHPRWRLGGLKCAVRFRIDLTYCFEDIKIQFFIRLAWNRLTTPTFWGFHWVLIPWTFFLKRHVLGWSRIVWGIDRENPSTRFCCRRRQEKGKERYHTNYLGLYFSYVIWGADHRGPISTKNGRVKGAHSIIILSNFVSIFSGVSDLQGSKSPSSHWLCWSSLPQCSQPVTMLVSLAKVPKT